MPIFNEHIESYSQFELVANQIVEGFLTGLHKSPFHGFSVEFAEHKSYNPGDSIKNIDWKLYARTEKLYLKKFEEETNLKCTVVVDTSSSMHFPESKNDSLRSLNKAGFAAYAAAALLTLLSKQRDAAGLITFNNSISAQTEIKGSKIHIRHLVDELGKCLSPTHQNSQTNISEALNRLAERVPKRSLVILFSDFLFQKNTEDLNAVTEALQHLKHNNHEVIVFHVLDHAKEIDLNYSNTPHKFIDLETGEIVKVNPKELQENYKETQIKIQNDLKNSLISFGIDYVEADVNQGFSKILQTYLLKRSKLF